VSELTFSEISFFVKNCDLAAKELIEPSSTDYIHHSNLILDNVLSKAIISDGFSLLQHEFGHISSPHKSSVYIQIENMYKYLEGKEESFSIPHSTQVNRALCKYLEDNESAISWTKMEDTNAIIKSLLPLWIEEYNHQTVPEEILTELIKIFTSSPNQYAFLRDLDEWKKSVAKRLQEMKSSEHQQPLAIDSSLDHPPND
jgi:hypothetical protein